MKSCSYSRELWKEADLAFFCPVTYWLTCFHSGACNLDKKLVWVICQLMASIICAVQFCYFSMLQLVEVCSVALEKFP